MVFFVAFFVAIKYDSVEFYLAPKIGNQFHSNHPKLTKEKIIFSPRLSNKETKTLIGKISKADYNKTIAANVVFSTTGVMLLRNDIHYFSG